MDPRCRILSNNKSTKGNEETSTEHIKIRKDHIKADNNRSEIQQKQKQKQNKINTPRKEEQKATRDLTRKN